jgi:hypothetical protein
MSTAPDHTSSSWPARAQYLHALHGLRAEISREMDRAQQDQPSEAALLTAWAQVAPLFAARCRPTSYGLFEPQ